MGGNDVSEKRETAQGTGALEEGTKACPRIPDSYPVDSVYPGPAGLGPAGQLFHHQGDIQQ